MFAQRTRLGRRSVLSSRGVCQTTNIMFNRIGRWIANAGPSQHVGVILAVLVLIYGAVELFSDPLGVLFVPPVWLVAIPLCWLAYIALWLLLRRGRPGSADATGPNDA